MLNEHCPHCGQHMGWGGLRGDFSAAQRALCGAVRWHCPSCRGALRPVRSGLQFRVQLLASLLLLANALASVRRIPSGGGAVLRAAFMTPAALTFTANL